MLFVVNGKRSSGERRKLQVMLLPPWCQAVMHEWEHHTRGSAAGGLQGWDLPAPLKPPLKDPTLLCTTMCTNISTSIYLAEMYKLCNGLWM